MAHHYPIWRWTNQADSIFFHCITNRFVIDIVFFYNINRAESVRIAPWIRTGCTNVTGINYFVYGNSFSYFREVLGFNSSFKKSKVVDKKCTEGNKFLFQLFWFNFPCLTTLLGVIIPTTRLKQQHLLLLKKI